MLTVILVIVAFLAGFVLGLSAPVKKAEADFEAELDRIGMVFSKNFNAISEMEKSGLNPELDLAARNLTRLIQEKADDYKDEFPELETVLLGNLRDLLLETVKRQAPKELFTETCENQE